MASEIWMAQKHIDMMPRSQKLGTPEMSQRPVSLGNIKHQSLITMYVYNMQGTAGGGVLLLVQNEAIHRAHELTEESLLLEPET